MFLLCGCATSVETPIRKPQPCSSPQPLRVAVLPPRIHPDIDPANLKAEKPFFKRLMDGRGIVVTSSSASKDIGLEIVSALTISGKYERIFTVENEAEAQQLNADTLMTVTVWDYRTVHLGANRKYPLMALLGPLMSQYWIRWQTLEARLEWEVKLTSITDNSVLYRKRLKRQYASSVRSASGHYFTDKMLSFLQSRATPDFIGELFEREMTLPPTEETTPEPDNQSIAQTMSAT